MAKSMPDLTYGSFQLPSTRSKTTGGWTHSQVRNPLLVVGLLNRTVFRKHVVGCCSPDLLPGKAVFLIWLALRFWVPMFHRSVGIVELCCLFSCCASKWMLLCNCSYCLATSSHSRSPWWGAQRYWIKFSCGTKAEFCPGELVGFMCFELLVSLLFPALSTCNGSAYFHFLPT
jgi:hypothetical protein